MSRPRTRLLVDAGLLALIVGATVAIAAPLEPVQPFLVLAAACLVPGGALLTRLNVDDVASAVGLAVSLSLAVDAAGSVALAWSGWWHPEVLAAVIGAASGALLLSDLRRVLRDRQPEGLEVPA